MRRDRESEADGCTVEPKVEEAPARAVIPGLTACLGELDGTEQTLELPDLVADKTGSSMVDAKGPAISLEIPEILLLGPDHAAPPGLKNGCAPVRSAAS